MNAWGRVDPAGWGDAPAFCVGGGPSLHGFKFERLHGRGHVICVNQAMFDSPCECAVTVDQIFVRNYADRLDAVAKQRPLYLSLGNEWWKGGLRLIEGAIYLRSLARTGVLAGLSFDPEALTRAPTSGFAGLNIAVLKGAKRIYLLGYDYRAFDDRHHYHDAYEWHHKAIDQSWPVWAKHYEKAAQDCLDHGIEVINASEKSALPYFRKTTLDEVLCG